MPEFRKNGFYTAYVEGWGLYAESLGGEMGFYKDPYSRFGQLTYEMWRAIRLVVDTGMHALGWSRQQAHRLLRRERRQGRARHRGRDRPLHRLARPGPRLQDRRAEDQGAARARAGALGERFDVRAFHDQVLGSGAVPAGRAGGAHPRLDGRQRAVFLLRPGTRKARPSAVLLLTALGLALLLATIPDYWDWDLHRLRTVIRRDGEQSMLYARSIQAVAAERRAAEKARRAALDIARVKGRVTGSIQGLFDLFVTDAVQQPDGRIVVVGLHNHYGLGLARLNVDGSLDEEFVRHANWETAGELTGSPEQVALAPDGKVLVAGRFDFEGKPRTLVRFHPDGTIDSAFLSATAALSPEVQWRRWPRVAIQPDGGVVFVEFDHRAASPSSCGATASSIAAGIRRWVKSPGSSLSSEPTASWFPDLRACRRSRRRSGLVSFPWGPEIPTAFFGLRAEQVSPSERRTWGFSPMAARCSFANGSWTWKGRRRHCPGRPLHVRRGRPEPLGVPPLPRQRRRHQRTAHAGCALVRRTVPSVRCVGRRFPGRRGRHPRGRPPVGRRWRSLRAFRPSGASPRAGPWIRSSGRHRAASSCGARTRP